MTDLRPAIGVATGAFGVSATVTFPGVPPVETTVFWLPTREAEYPTGQEYRRAEPLRVMVIPLAGLASVPPRGTVVTAPEYAGAPAVNWKVDEAHKVDFDHYRAVMVPQ